MGFIWLGLLAMLALGLLWLLKLRGSLLTLAAASREKRAADRAAIMNASQPNGPPQHP